MMSDAVQMISPPATRLPIWSALRAFLAGAGVEGGLGRKRRAADGSLHVPAARGLLALGSWRLNKPILYVAAVVLLEQGHTVRSMPGGGILYRPD